MTFSLTTGYNSLQYFNLSWFKEAAMPVLIIGDAETHCPICDGILTRKKEGGKIIKICPNGHQFVVKNPIINLRKEEK